MLLDALATLDARLEAQTGRLPFGGPLVVAVITGKGPLKEHYQGQMRALRLRHVAICTMWLEPADYPRLLGAADLGVCLHTSTSGLDLPMKVLDMFGCGLPVCAVGFACLDELVTHNANGLVFESSSQLSTQLHTLLAPTDEAAASLKRLQDGVRLTEARRPRWAENWQAVAAPLLLAPKADGVLTSAVRQLVRAVMWVLCALMAWGLVWEVGIELGMDWCMSWP